MRKLWGELTIIIFNDNLQFVANYGKTDMKTKVCLPFILCALLAVSSSIQAVNVGGLQGTARGYREISSEELKTLMNSGQKMIVVDARTKDYDDSIRIPGAISLPCSSTQIQIVKACPDKNMSTIIYCTNIQSPQSRFLAEKMVKMGYKQVMVCTDGIKGWMQKSYPTEHKNN